MKALVGTTSGLLTVDSSVEELIAGTRINHVLTSEDGWWAVDGKGRVHHNGQVVASMPPETTPLCVQPGRDVTWIGTSEAHLFVLEGDRLSKDEFFDNSPGREAWHTPWGGPPDTRSLALDTDLTLFVNVHVGGILRYDNTGPTPTLDITADVHQVAAHPSRGGVVLAASARGLAFSRNGHDFDFVDDGLHAPYCRAVAVADDWLLVSASTGPRSDRARVYRSQLGATTLQPVTAGLPEWFDANVDTHCLAVSGPSAFLGHGDTLWRSDDAGLSWSVVADKLPRVTSVAAWPSI